jgi:hypothetical protein
LIKRFKKVNPNPDDEDGVFNKCPIVVTVLGTEERDCTTFHKYTSYIIEIKIANIA